MTQTKQVSPITIERCSEQTKKHKLWINYEKANKEGKRTSASNKALEKSTIYTCTDRQGASEDGNRRRKKISQIMQSTQLHHTLLRTNY